MSQLIVYTDVQHASVIECAVDCYILGLV